MASKGTAHTVQIDDTVLCGMRREGGGDPGKELVAVQKDRIVMTKSQINIAMGYR